MEIGDKVRATLSRSEPDYTSIPTIHIGEAVKSIPVHLCKRYYYPALKNVRVGLKYIGIKVIQVSKLFFTVIFTRIGTQF